MSDKDEILAANAAFYVALSTGDLRELARLWADDDGISCIHPGWPAIVGRTDVISSWRDIFASAARPKITCREPHAIITGDSGRVLCIELVGRVVLAATNHFQRIADAWRLVHHQSSPIAGTLSEDSDDPPEPTRRIH